MNTVLDKETREIYEKEIKSLIQNDPKYITLGPDELESIVKAFAFTLTNGRDKVRAQMLYDLIKEKRES